MSARIQETPDKSEVLTKALLNCADQLGLKPTELGAALGVHRSAVSRLKHSTTLDPDSKQGEIAMMLIRITRALYALTGGDKAWMQHFMRTPNRETGGIPKEQIATLTGLTTVLQFTDAVRAKI